MIVTQRERTAGNVEVYSLLTIGDTVSQIPALLISNTAGIVVTRAASEVEGVTSLRTSLRSCPTTSPS